MDQATQPITPRRFGADVDVLPSYYPVPGYGLVPINAFVIHAAQPVLVDTGPILWAAAYRAAIERVIALEDLRWIWLTHTDPDHIGCLREILDAAPNATLVTTFIGLGKLGIYGPLPLERVHLLNPGQLLDVGDRQLVAWKPPSYDAPETTGLFDTRTRTLFSSDCFGALLSGPADDASEIPSSTLRDGAVLWATVDCPWLAMLVPETFDAVLGTVRDLAPAAVLSSHCPPAVGMLDAQLANLSVARFAPPFVGPDQNAFMQMLAAAPSAAPASFEAAHA